MHDRPVADMQVIDVGGILVFGQREYVYIVEHRGDHCRFGAVILDDFILFFDLLCFFEPQFSCQFLHLFIQMFAYLRDIPA